MEQLFGAESSRIHAQSPSSVLGHTRTSGDSSLPVYHCLQTTNAYAPAGRNPDCMEGIENIPPITPLSANQDVHKSWFKSNVYISTRNLAEATSTDDDDILSSHESSKDAYSDTETNNNHRPATPSSPPLLDDDDLQSELEIDENAEAASSGGGKIRSRKRKDHRHLLQQRHAANMRERRRMQSINDAFEGTGASLSIF